MADEDARRLPPESRWPGVLQRNLGDRVHVLEAGLPGRTTVLDDPLGAHRNGAALLQPTLLTHAPVDVLILAVGVNDLKRRFGSRAYDVACGISTLVRIARETECGPVQGTPPKIVVVAPPPIRPTGVFSEMFADAEAESRSLGARYRDVAAALSCGFVDSGDHVDVSDVDGIHLDGDAHAVLGAAIAAAVSAVLNSRAN
jgi:lysophospholipase L1-like esterase